MKRLLRRISFFLRRVVCRLFGHASHNKSIATVGIVFCTRCLRIIDYRTVLTRGDLKRRMATNPPAGFSFVSCNWKSAKRSS